MLSRIRNIGRRLAALVGLCVVGPSAVGCVAQDAGYADVRRSVLSRARQDVRWGAVDEEGRTGERLSRLVSAPLTADAAVQVAMLNNADVQAAFEELGIARADLVRALRLPNPIATTSVAFHKGIGPDVEFGALIGLDELLFLPWRSGAAQAGLEAAKLAVAGAILDIALDARSAYFRYVAARQVVELRRTVLLAARGSYDSAKELHDAGNITDLDLANERALYEDARLLVARAETEESTERARLASLLGLSASGGAWKTVDRLPNVVAATVPPGDVERHALEKSIDLELARRRFTAAAKRANLARAEGLLPALQAGVTFEKEQNEPWGVGPAAQLQVPLFYQGAGEVARARSEMRREQHAYTAAAVQIRASAQDIAKRLETAREAIAFYREVQLPLREQIVQQTQLQYNAMNISVFQLLQAKRDQVDTARAYVETQRDYWIAKSELDQLLAGRLVRARTGTPEPEDRPERGRDRH